MKRANNLFERIPDWDNLVNATARALRGKRDRAEVRRFLSRLDEELAGLIGELRDGSYRGAGFRQFTIFDPKERVISAPSFRDRVAHHAIMNVCEPELERFQIHRSYACRVGKGTRAALQEARRLAVVHREGFWLKTDVRKYFDSVPHARLLAKLERRFGEPALIELFRRILAEYQTMPGRGLPIGSLISQHLANFYLAHLDHFVPRISGMGAWVRYMDDGVAWARDRVRLNDLGKAIRGFLRDELDLELKREPVLQRVRLGMDFLGMRIYPDRMVVARATRKRMRRKLKEIDREFGAGRIWEAKYAERVQSLFARLLWPEVKSGQFRGRLLEENRARVDW